MSLEEVLKEYLYKRVHIVVSSGTKFEGHLIGGTLHAILQQKGLNVGTVSKKHPNH